MRIIQVCLKLQEKQYGGTNKVKIKYHCSGRWDNKSLVELIESEKIKYDDCDDRYFVFDFYSDNPKCEEILNSLNRQPRPLIIQEAIYSKEEMQKAEWYEMYATRQVVDTRDWDYTYEFLCPYQHGEDIRYKHMTQVRPFILQGMPKWKPRFNFCTDACGDFSLTFCSDYGKEKLIEKGITGIEFMPVLKGDRKTPKENIHQLKFTQILPREAFDFIGQYKEIVCPICGKINYAFKEPMLDNIRIRKDMIPEGVDAFISEMNTGEGRGFKLLIASKKLYRLLTEEMQEKHFHFAPIG